MNWGYRLTFVFMGFAALIFTLVYKAVHTKYELVSKDYYSEELRYQEQIDGMNNASAAGNISVLQDDWSLHVTLPRPLQDFTDSAHTWFYCKTDASKDRRINPVFIAGKADIDTKNFTPGNYELRLRFTANKQQYYYSQPVHIP